MKCCFIVELHTFIEQVHFLLTHFIDVYEHFIEFK